MKNPDLCEPILAEHHGNAPEFSARLAQIPDGPFGTQYAETPTFGRILED